MRKILLLIATIFSLAASPQVKMMIYMSNGELKIYDKTDVDSVTFDRLEYIDKFNGHKYTDLGLPSGTKWATCNIGAESPEELGDFYEWGETETKDTYYNSENKHFLDDRIIKYNTNEEWGTVDNKTILDQEDDVAHVKWGGTWRIPTIEEIEELINVCQHEAYKIGNVNGIRFIGPNGKSIFLPCAGHSIGTTQPYPGGTGSYWSSSLNTKSGDCRKANSLKISKSGYKSLESVWRRQGNSVRAVAK